MITVKNLVDIGDLELLINADTGKEVTGVYVGDLLSWVMGRAKAGNVWITIMSNINVIAVAALTEASCVILAEGAELDTEALTAAEEKQINIIKSRYPVYETAVMLSKLLK